MLKRLKRGLYLLLAGVIVLAVIAIIWSLTPVRSGFGESDPTVVFENQRSANGQTFTESYFRHEGVDIHYVETGKEGADTILFMHGFPSYWYSFVRQIEALRSDYRIIAVDGLGAGRSDAPKDVELYKLANMAEHVKALLEHNNVSQVHLIGHDWGSAFVFGFAQKYPELVKSVVGVSAPPQNILLKLLNNNANQRKASTYIEKLKNANPILLKALGVSDRIWEGAYFKLLKAGKLSPEEAQQFRQATSNVRRINTHINWYRANVPSVEEIQEDDFWPGYDSRLEVPAMVVWGNDDRAFEDEFIGLLSESSTDLQVLKLDGVGHWPHVEESKTVTNAIKSIINKTQVISN